MTGTRRLLILPCEPGRGDGYSLAVAADLARLAPRPGDVVVYRSARPARREDGALSIGTATAAGKAWNILRGRPPYELGEAALRRCLAAVEGDFEEIFAGEIFFYRALRRMFPAARIQARSHNFYGLGRCRQLLSRPPSNFRHTLNLVLYSRLEMEILADPKASLAFITEEELAFARLLAPLAPSTWWPVVDPGLGPKEGVAAPSAPRLVFFGSAAASHTAIGLDLLCRDVMPRLRGRLPRAELHLFGHGSEAYDAPARGIHGHGRFPGAGLPFDGDGLFCVPDVHGCGVKLKVADLLKGGAPFISTPLGLSGYHLPPHPHILVHELGNWAEAVAAYFQAQGLDQAPRSRP